MTQLQMENLTLTYEGVFATPMFSLIYSPGLLFDLLLENLEVFGCTAADLDIEDGEPADRAVVCEIDEFDARLTIHGDRLEVFFRRLYGHTW